MSNLFIRHPAGTTCFAVGLLLSASSFVLAAETQQERVIEIANEALNGYQTPLAHMKRWVKQGKVKQVKVDVCLRDHSYADWALKRAIMTASDKTLSPAAQKASLESFGELSVRAGDAFRKCYEAL